MKAHACGVLSGLALLALVGSCSSDKSGSTTGGSAGRHPDAERAMAACLDAIGKADALEPSVKLATVARDCAGLYVEKGCREAWERALTGPPDERMPTIVRACRDAYCPQLSEPRPALCAATDPGAIPAAWSELQLAILQLDLGSERTSRFAAGMQTAIDYWATRSIESLSIEIPRLPGPATQCDHEFAMLVTERGVWLGTTTGERRFAARCKDQHDVDAIVVELERLRGLDGLECAGGVTLVADPQVTYQEVITTLDLAIAAGLSNSNFADRSSSPVKFPEHPNKTESLTPRCGAASLSETVSQQPTVKAQEVAPSPTPPSELPDNTTAAGGVNPPGTAGQSGLEKAPIVIITATDIVLDGHIATVREVAAAKDDKIPELERRLDARAAQITADIQAGETDEELAGVLILQADRSTPAGVLNRVITTANGAGFANVLFVVDRKGD